MHKINQQQIAAIQRYPYWVRKLIYFFNRFPLQLWLVFLGNFIVSVASSMSWPFLNIYLRQRLGLPLHLSTLLASTRAVTGIVASLTIGSVSDRFGRRGIMLASVIGGVLFHGCMAYADQAWEFLLLLAAWGALDNFYSIGCNAMVVDTADKDSQLEAFSLNRMAHNTGIAIGPIIGGMIVTHSYQLNYQLAAAIYVVPALMILFFVKESLKKPTPAALAEANPKKSDGTMRRETNMLDVFRDRVFMASIGFLILITVGTSTVFNLLPLYANEVYRIPESHISIVFSVNAILCVALQLGAARAAARLHPFSGMVLSAALYMIGITSYAFFPSVAWYCACMTVMTIGEVILAPTMLALTARRAPEDARGRYMGIFNLAYPFGYAIGPAIGGNIFEYVSPQGIWYNGGLFCLIAMIGYSVLYRKNKKEQ